MAVSLQPAGFNDQRDVLEKNVLLPYLILSNHLLVNSSLDP